MGAAGKRALPGCCRSTTCCCYADYSSLTTSVLQRCCRSTAPVVKKKAAMKSGSKMHSSTKTWAASRHAEWAARGGGSEK
eukprot:3167087-Prymnesium_polylepis.2